MIAKNKIKKIELICDPSSTTSIGNCHKTVAFFISSHEWTHLPFMMSPIKKEKIFDFGELSHFETPGVNSTFPNSHLNLYDLIK